MPEKLKIVNGVLVAALAYDLYATRKNAVRYKKMKENNQLLRINLHHAEHVIDYLANKLADNEIPMTEFDVIALNNPDL